MNVTKLDDAPVLPVLSTVRKARMRLTPRNSEVLGALSSAPTGHTHDLLALVARVF